MLYLLMVKPAGRLYPRPSHDPINTITSSSTVPVGTARVIDVALAVLFEDVATRTLMLQTVGTLGLAPARDEILTTTPPVEQTSSTDSVDSGVVSSPAIPVQDPVVARIVELRSRDAERVRRALISSPLTLALVPHVLPLLAWDEVVSATTEALRGIAPTVTGQLVDRLIDED